MKYFIPIIAILFFILILYVLIRGIAISREKARKARESQEKIVDIDNDIPTEDNGFTPKTPPLEVASPREKTFLEPEPDKVISKLDSQSVSKTANRKADNPSNKKVIRKSDKSNSKPLQSKQDVVKISSIKEKKEKLQQEKEKLLRDEAKALKEKKKQEESLRIEEQKLFLSWINNKGKPISKSEKVSTTQPIRRVKPQKVTSKTESEIQLDQFNEFKQFINNRFKRNQSLRMIKNQMTDEQLKKYGLYTPLLSTSISVGDLVKINNYCDASTFISFEIDAHGYKLLEFKKLMQSILTIKCKKEVHIICIHGQNQGTVLKDYILKELQSSRIKERNLHPQNGGRTDLILR